MAYEILAKANDEDYMMSFSLNTISRIKDKCKFAVTASENGTVWFLDGDKKAIVSRIVIVNNGLIEKDFNNPIEIYEPGLRQYINLISSHKDDVFREENKPAYNPFKEYMLPSGEDFKVHEKGFAVLSDKLGHDFDLTLNDAEEIVNILRLSKLLKEHEKK